MEKDAFSSANASLSFFSVLQGLFLPSGFIPSLLFFPTGIISIGQIHLWLALFFRRDYFGRLDSSPACSFSPQGLFRPPGFHPQPALFPHRDDFYRSDSSLACSFLPQGLFRPPGFIPTSRFPPLRMHLCKVSL